jgi:hypothetical protein
MSSPKKEIKAFIHNVSPVKNNQAKTTTFFDMILQTDSGYKRAVCFSPGKHAIYKVSYTTMISFSNLISPPI